MGEKCQLDPNKATWEKAYVLRPTSEIISKNHDSFPFDEIVNKFKGHTKSLVFTEEDIEKILSYEYEQGYTFSVLTMLYPTLDYRNRFHIDHIFPKSLFRRNELLKRGIGKDKVDTYLDILSELSNLQLLEGVPNQEKLDNDFEEWLYKVYPSESVRNDYRTKNHITLKTGS
jgi:hypothetical protein